MAAKKKKKGKKAEKNTTVEVSGDVRRAAAIVEGTPIGLTQQGDSHKGRGSITVAGSAVSVSVQLRGEASAAFKVATTITGLGTATRKGRFPEDTEVVMRGWEIPKGDFEEDDDA